MGTDWVHWHRPYDEPESQLRQRLLLVQGEVRAALDRAAPGPVRVLSLCAGQGRDLLGPLGGHPRRDDVRARLVELDEGNVEIARHAIAVDGLRSVEVVRADAALTDAYAGAVPADLALVCGVFGNISDDDTARTIDHLPRLCGPGATVLWTRHRLDPDLTPSIRRWFDQAGFEELAFHAPAETAFSVGANRLAKDPLPFAAGVRLFRFLW